MSKRYNVFVDEKSRPEIQRVASRLIARGMIVNAVDADSGMIGGTADQDAAHFKSVPGVHEVEDDVVMDDMPMRATE